MLRRLFLRHQQQLPIRHQRHHCSSSGVVRLVGEHCQGHSARVAVSWNISKSPLISRNIAIDRLPICCLYRRHVIRYFSTTPYSSGPDDPLKQDGRRYLCRETFPIGSLGAKAVEDTVTLIQRLISAKAKNHHESIQLAFELLDRLSQEVEFASSNTINKNQTGDRSFGDSTNLRFLIPEDLLHDVVRAWSVCWDNKSTNLSPRHAFERLIGWESLPSHVQTFLVSYSMIIHASKTLQDPDLAEQILYHMLECSSRGLLVDPV